MAYFKTLIYKSSFYIISFAFVFLSVVQIGYAEALKIAVASNFSHTMKAIAAEYKKNNGRVISISSGSSGKLYSQIRAGAPFDLFFSADQEKPALLTAANLTLTASQNTYALGNLALWSNIKTDKTVELKLKTMSFKKLALANPTIAPYGKASVEVLRALDLERQTKSHWVLGENISQTFQFVYSGAAELGFVSLSHLLQLENLQDLRVSNDMMWKIPKHLYSPIKQDVVILKSTNKLVQAREFLGFFRSERVKRLLIEDGYTLPE